MTIAFQKAVRPCGRTEPVITVDIVVINKVISLLHILERYRSIG